ncbi:MAG: ROK family protein [Acidobacteria bacterium]|nr:ROK family protein [Acidobacteriota bacterium]MBV9144376.1 ROK family protein [Acidobacteriota bacterium]MBV9434776.1 ROK family protein [Acidobacteriota bacterium]
MSTDSQFAIGVDLGGTNMRIAAVESTGKQLELITTSTEVKRGRDYVVGDMCDAIRALRKKFEGKYRFAGTGIGVPGIIDMETGTVHKSPNLPDWTHYPVREEIQRRLESQVILENDANVAALGEKWMGAARDVDSMCMFTLGTGVGSGLVLGGKIWHGMMGMAGECGHITVFPDGVPCGCGNRGCVEQYASATAVKRMAIEAIATGRAPELARAMSENPEFSSKVVFQYATQGDAAAKKIFDVVGRALGVALADMINALNLPMYVIGGGVASGWEAFAPAMFDELHKRSYVYAATAPDDRLPTRKHTLITRALLGSDAGLIGAARLALA